MTFNLMERGLSFLRGEFLSLIYQIFKVIVKVYKKMFAKIMNWVLCFFVTLSFFACNQDGIDEIATRSDVVKRGGIPDDNWHAALEITEALDTVSLQIAEKIRNHKVVALSVFGEEESAGYGPTDGSLGLTIGDDGLTCGFNVYVTGSSGNRIFLVSRASCPRNSTLEFKVPFNTGADASGMIWFNPTTKECRFRSTPFVDSNKTCYLWMVFATDFIPAGYGYYKRYLPRHLDLSKAYWEVIPHSEYKHLDLSPNVNYFR